jgi:signal transduction histidine kinase
MMENNHFNNRKEVEVSIHNNGLELKPKILNSFDKFYQSRDQNVKKPIGSGLV